MRYVAAYCLAVLGGNESPSAGDLKTILDSVGVDAVDDQLNKVINELKGKNLEEVIAAGKSKSNKTLTLIKISLTSHKLGQRQDVKKLLLKF